MTNSTVFQTVVSEHAVLIGLLLSLIIVVVLYESLAW